jgi:hypothetical protein
MANAAFDVKSGTLMECTGSASNVPGSRMYVMEVFCIYSSNYGKYSTVSATRKPPVGLPQRCQRGISAFVMEAGGRAIGHRPQQSHVNKSIAREACVVTLSICTKFGPFLSI